MSDWSLVEVGTEDDPIDRWIVMELDEKQRPTLGIYRYWHKETAMGYAEFLNKHGHNVVVYEEHAYCTRNRDE